MQDQLAAAIKAHDVDYVDIRIEDKTNSWVNFRGPELDTIGSSRTTGGIVRALYKGGWGYATFNDLENLDQRVREACQTAKLVGRDESQLAEVDPVVDVIKAELVKDFRQVPLAEKKALMDFTKAMTAAQAKGYIAPFKAVEAIDKGLSYDIDADLKREAELFADCAVSDVARNLIGTGTARK